MTPFFGKATTATTTNNATSSTNPAAAASSAPKSKGELMIANVNKLLNLLGTFELDTLTKSAQVNVQTIIERKLKTIKRQVDRPVSAEQLIVILVNMLSMEYDHHFEFRKSICASQSTLSSGSNGDRYDVVTLTDKLIKAIRACLDLENNKALKSQFDSIFNRYHKDSNVDEQVLSNQLKKACKNSITAIDLDEVMEVADRAHRSTDLANQNAILVVGVTGAGKSFLLNLMACPDMFSRGGLFSNGDIKIDTKKQPAYMKHIAIGQSVVSKTSTMGVIPVDKFQDKAMRQFHGQNFILCDTPGASDNRKQYGDEMKLANALETVGPVYKAQSVRFLVLISANADSKRGAELVETIQYLSSMFKKAAGVTAAAGSMVFALTRDEAMDKKDALAKCIDEIGNNQKDLGLTDKDMAVINVMKAAFKKDKTLLIRPGKKHTTKPQEVMDAVAKAMPTSPQAINPFAEASIVNNLQTEWTTLARAMSSAFDLLKDHTVEAAIKSLAVKRLGLYFEKLSFMHTYYKMDDTTLDSMFDQVKVMVNSVAKSISDVLCPSNGKIDPSRIGFAEQQLELLRELDGMSRLLVINHLGESRPCVMKFLNAMQGDADKIVEPSADLNALGWMQWRLNNIPKSRVTGIRRQVKQFRLAQIEQLKALIAVASEDVSIDYLEKLQALPKFAPDAIPHTTLVALAQEGTHWQTQISSALSLVSAEDTTLEAAIATLTATRKANLGSCHSDVAGYMELLADTTHNLRTQTERFPWLFDLTVEEVGDAQPWKIAKEAATANSSSVPTAPPVSDTAVLATMATTDGSLNADDGITSIAAPSAPPYNSGPIHLVAPSQSTQPDPYQMESKVLEVAFDQLHDSLIERANGAVMSHQFLLALSIVEKLEALNHVFGFRETDTLEQLRKTFSIQFETFLKATTKAIALIGDESHTISEQRLLLDTHSIHLVRKHLLFSKIADQNTLYPTLSLAQDAYANAIDSQFDSLSQPVLALTKQPFSIDNLAVIAEQLSKMWFVLSLPVLDNSNNVQRYQAMLTAVKQYCNKTIGELKGHFSVDNAVKAVNYDGFAQLVNALVKSHWLKTLDLMHLTVEIDEVVNDRTAKVVAKLEKFDVSFGQAANLALAQPYLLEAGKMAKVFGALLFKRSCTAIENAHTEYLNGVRRALASISPEMEAVLASAETALPHQLMEKSHEYFLACETLGLLADEVQQAQANLTDGIKAKVVANNVVLMRMLDDLKPGTVVAADAVKPVQAIMLDCHRFENAQESIYAACDTPMVTYASQLQDLAIEYRTALTAALAKASMGEVSNHELLIKSLNALLSFDKMMTKYLPEEPAPTLFKTILDQFKNAFTNEYFNRLSDVYKNLSSGKYNAVVELLEQDIIFAPGSEMRGHVQTKVNVFIASVMATSASSLQALAKNGASDTAAVLTLDEQHHLLGDVNKLSGVGMMTADELQACQTRSQKIEQVIVQWFADSVREITALIESLDFAQTFQRLRNLNETLGKMTQKPDGHAVAMTTLQTALDHKFKLCSRQYSDQFVDWSNHQHSLAQVTRAYDALIKVGVAGDAYQDDWQKITKQVMAVIDAECDDIEKAFGESKAEDVSITIGRVDAVTTLMKSLPDDITDLKGQIKRRALTVLQAVQQANSAMKAGKARIARTQKLMAACDALSGELGTVDTAVSASLIQEEIDRLYGKVATAFDDHQLESDLVLQLFVFNQEFSGRFDFVKTTGEQCQARLTELMNVHLQSLTAAKDNFLAGTDTIAALTEVDTALVGLVKIQRLAEQAPDWVDADLPLTVVTLLQAFKDSLLVNNKRLKAGLENRDSAELAGALATSAQFNVIMLNMTAFIEACPSTGKVGAAAKQLRQLAKTSNYQGVCETILTKIKSIKSALSTLDPQRLSQQGTEIRRQFYQQLKRDLQFIRRLPPVVKHIDDALLKAAALGDDFGLSDCLDEVEKFLATVFREACQQLNNSELPTAETKWDAFNQYYRELQIFVDECATDLSLSKLELDKSSLVIGAVTERVKAPEVGTFLRKQFKFYLAETVDRFRKDVLAGLIPATGVGSALASMVSSVAASAGITATSDNDDNETLDDSAIIDFLTALQKMESDMDVPALKNQVHAAIKLVLTEIRSSLGAEYIPLLAEKLRADTSGFGAMVVAKQSIFAGMMTEARNKLTIEQDIDYVLEHMQVEDAVTHQPRGLVASESDPLKAAHADFVAQFEATLAEYTVASKKFASNEESCLGELKDKLLAQVRAINADRSDRGQAVWNDKVKQAIPGLLSTVFTIWSLQSSPAYFDESNTDANQQYLKKPHPAQIVAILEMLDATNLGSDKIESRINEVLTGEGKSVVLAASASIHTLLGYAVDTGCYSEYLSDRDEADFAWLFKLIGVEDHVQYGTFSRLSEEWLNQSGDLRDLMRQAMFGDSGDVKPGKKSTRPTIAYIDEIDSLVTSFFGRFYQPYFLLEGDNITALLDAIWDGHNDGTVASLADVYRLDAYTRCLDTYPKHEHLFRYSVSEMYRDLQRYKRDDGHDFHVNADGEIYYKHYDGTSTSKSIGYRTYWTSRDGTYKVSKLCRQRLEGLKVTCGAYSYAELMRDNGRYEAMLGVTGTYRQLSASERAIVKDVFGIEQASFIPSAYGKNKLVFNTGQHVKVVADDEFHTALCETIGKLRVGYVNQNLQRPILMFFETEASLNAFLKSTKFTTTYDPSDVNIMSSSTITSTLERDTRISRAARAGQITFAVKDHGRGSDFILSSTDVITNGGMAVIDAFVPETEADERQHQGRAGRQGQDGSFSMVIRQSELAEKFNMMPSVIDYARNQGTLYEVICKARNERFEKQYAELVSDSAEMDELLGEPSAALRATMTAYANGDLDSPSPAGAVSSSAVDDDNDEVVETPQDAVIAAHRATLPMTQAIVQAGVAEEVKVLILFDSTGSMGNLIDALKATLKDVVSSIGEVFGNHNIPFSLQIAHYEDYESTSKFAFRATPKWTTDAQKLSDFIDVVQPNGGAGNESECVEVGLCYANALVDEGLQHVILIGDEPPTKDQADIDFQRDQYYYDRNHAENSHHMRYRSLYPVDEVPEDYYPKARFYQKEAADLADAGVPVSTYFVQGGHGQMVSDNAKRTFAEIAKTTGGAYGELDLSNSDKAATVVTDLFARKICTAAAKGDTKFAEALVKEVNEKLLHSFSK